MHSQTRKPWGRECFKCNLDPRALLSMTAGDANNQRKHWGLDCFKCYVARFTTHAQTCLAANQVVAS